MSLEQSFDFSSRSDICMHVVAEKMLEVTNDFWFDKLALTVPYCLKFALVITEVTKLTI